MADEGFIAVPSAALPFGQKLSFDLYLQVGGNLVLYATAGACLDQEQVQRLSRNSQSNFFAQRKDPAYLKYYEENLSRILDEPRTATRVKSQVFYHVSTNLVKNILDDPRSGATVKRSQAVVQNLVGFVLVQKDAFFNLLKITSHDYYTYTHSVNVCTLAVGLALRLGIRTRADCSLVGLGGLLHDVGKCMVDLPILNKRGPLTDEEWQVMRKHPEWGADRKSVV